MIKKLKKLFFTILLCFNFFCLYSQRNVSITEVIIPAGIDSMGDHFKFGDPVHPSDEVPIHLVKTDSFYMAKYITTNQQYIDYLNSAKASGLIEVRGDTGVFPVGGNDLYCYLNKYSSYYSIGYNGTFYLPDFRANHPVVGVMWDGAAAYCNWLSLQNSLQPCYNLTTYDCSFSNNGYRLPTEAEWEWAARGGHTTPYLQYPNGNTADVNAANLSGSYINPYHSGSSPFTTPVGFFDGTLKLKSTYNWPGSATSYQTNNGINGFGLYDMQGNVWQYCNDWYLNTYYSVSIYNNPTGPLKSAASLMPDGLPYRCQRGGNWWNGDSVYGVNDGHSRVSNRDPLYYRGPGGPWHQEGFRVARKFEQSVGIINKENNFNFDFKIFPNPSNSEITINYNVPENSNVQLSIFDLNGKEIYKLVSEQQQSGKHSLIWNSSDLLQGIYILKSIIGNNIKTQKIIITK